MPALLESFESLPFYELFLCFFFVVTAFHLWLDLRQLKALKSPRPPPVLAEHFDEALYKKTQAYSLDKWWFGLAQSIYSFLETLVQLHCNFLPYLWGMSGVALTRYWPASLSAWLHPAGASEGLGPRFEMAQTVVFVLALLGCNMVLGLPWSLYRTFVIEERHGFNKQTLGLFFTDLVKSAVLGLLLIPPVIVAMTYILHVGGAYLALYLWGFILALSLLLMAIYPEFIAPLFNKYDPLEEGSLRTRIEQLASSLKFPLRKLFKVDGSKRSAHSNAYMYGFWKNKRIVLYDTLLTQCSEEQVVAVLAHELGHWKLRHTPMLFGVGQLVTLFSFSLFTFIRNTRGLYLAFGFKDMPAFISLVLFQFVSAPMDEVIHYLQNLVSRTFEFQADGFAILQGHGKDLRTALLKLEEENKSAMQVDLLYSAYHYSHPPLAERLKAIDAGLQSYEKKES